MLSCAGANPLVEIEIIRRWAYESHHAIVKLVK